MLDRAYGAWLPWANLMALIANCHRDPKHGSALRWQDFHPFEVSRPRGMAITVDNFDRIADVICSAGDSQPRP